MANVTVNVDLALKLAKIYRAYGDSVYADQIEESARYRSTSVDVVLGGLPVKALHEIQGLVSGDKALASRIAAYLRIVENPEKPFGRLDNLPEAFYRWMTIKSIDGWLYTIDSTTGVHVAWAVEKCRYHRAEGSGDSYTPAYVSIDLVANNGAGSSSQYRSRSRSSQAGAHTKFSAQDVVQMSVPELLALRGYFKETPELKAVYTKYVELFLAYQPQYNVQFIGGGTVVGDRGESQVNSKSKFINDEAMIERNITLLKSNDQWVKYGAKPDEFVKIPIHPFLYMFDLRLDHNCWIHVSQIEPYQYDKTVTDKLVLPQNHRDLIDILVQDMDVFVDDIVAGKSGGTAILCYGEPGLGKTLTAECYSEIVERPLYKVHSGQLGTSAKTVEDTLKKILERAERWGAILLLHEADVYVARRGNNLDRNAVVASFLRSLEYFNGLMFLTTNRIDDVDDAIVSRMIALFHFERPDDEMSDRLWKILAKQFEIELTDAQAKGLVKEFPGLPGRDVKQLLKLVKKYCQYKNERLSMKAFRVCAMFRGIDGKINGKQTSPVPYRSDEEATSIVYRKAEDAPDDTD